MLQICIRYAGKTRLGRSFLSELPQVLEENQYPIENVMDDNGGWKRDKTTVRDIAIQISKYDTIHYANLMEKSHLKGFLTQFAELYTLTVKVSVNH
jgi:hypothetical protein